MATETIHIDRVDPVDGQALRPSPARVYDYLLGGKDHYGHDRQVAAAMSSLAPCLGTTVRAGRRFMGRIAHHLAAEHGIAQFLDVGAGMPNWPNLHDVVQQAVPAARVVYVDSDPMVTAHARALLTSGRRGITECVEADLRRPDRILTAPQLQHAIDPSRPVAVLMMAVLHVVPDDDQVRRIAADLLAPWPSGSVLAISTACLEGAPEQSAALARFGRVQRTPMQFRSLDRIRALFDGLELEEPGVVPVHRWCPTDLDRRLRDHQVMLAGGLAIKP
jgi:hypothetical protein